MMTVIQRLLSRSVGNFFSLFINHFVCKKKSVKQHISSVLNISLIYSTISNAFGTDPCLHVQSVLQSGFHESFARVNPD